MRILLSTLIAVAYLPLGTAAQAQGNSMIFFDWGKQELTSDARIALDRVGQEFLKGGKRLLRLESHSDRSGPPSVNRRMSAQRAMVAKAYLIGLGVPSSAIRIEAIGEQNPLIETADGVREVQNRRIEIIVE